MKRQEDLSYYFIIDVFDYTKVKYKDDDDVFRLTKTVNVYNTKFVFHDQKLIKITNTYLKKCNPKFWTKWVNASF